MEKIKHRARQWRDAATRFVWQTRKGERPAVQWIMIRMLRTVILAVQGFVRNQGTLRASAMTFFTLLSLVPVVAMAFGIAKGFGFEKRLHDQLLQNFSAQQAVVEQVIAFAQNMLNNTRGGMIAGIGVVVLFWSVIRLLGNIEHCFNHIWGVRSRSFIRKLSDYLTIMLICPVLVIMSGSVTVFITSQVSAISGRFELLQMVGPVIYVGLKLLPFALVWILLTLVYLIMPNTKVRFDGALLAGVVAGTAYQAVQATYIHLQIIVAKYNAIYGSFAALPLFLVWLQVSWLIVIIGAEISHAYQHSDFVDETAGGRHMSILQTKVLALSICRYVVARFAQGLPPQPPPEIATSLSLPPALVDNLCDLLVKGNILVRVENDDDDAPALQPAQDIHRMTIEMIVTALENVGADRCQPFPQTASGPLAEAMAAIHETLERSDANRRIMDIS